MVSVGVSERWKVHRLSTLFTLFNIISQNNAVAYPEKKSREKTPKVHNYIKGLGDARTDLLFVIG